HVVGGWLAAAVKTLLGAVVDARNARSRQVDGKRIKYQLAIFRRSAKTALLVSFVDLVVIVKHRDHVLAEPCEIAVIIQLRIAKKRKVFVRFGKPFHHGLKPSGDIFDPKGRIQAGCVHHRPCMTTPARHLARQKKTLLSKTLGELVNGSAEYSCRCLAHVLDG